MRALLLVSAVLLTSCTIIPTQHGKVVLGGDYTHLSFEDGSVHFSADRANHSTVVKQHWHGASSLAAQAVAGAIGLQGGTGNEVVGAVVTAIPPIVNRPTNRPVANP